MTYIGHIRNGVVVLDDPADLPEGTVVRVEPAAAPAEAVKSGRERLLGLAGVLTDLPSDLARNHDHYLYGHPKQ